MLHSLPGPSRGPAASAEPEAKPRAGPAQRGVCSSSQAQRGEREGAVHLLEECLLSRPTVVPGSKRQPQGETGAQLCDFFLVVARLWEGCFLAWMLSPCSLEGPAVVRDMPLSPGGLAWHSGGAPWGHLKPPTRAFVLRPRCCRPEPGLRVCPRARRAGHLGLGSPRRAAACSVLGRRHHTRADKDVSEGGADCPQTSQVHFVSFEITVRFNLPLPIQCSTKSAVHKTPDCNNHKLSSGGCLHVRLNKGTKKLPPRGLPLLGGQPGWLRSRSGSGHSGSGEVEARSHVLPKGRKEASC